MSETYIPLESLSERLRKVAVMVDNISEEMLKQPTSKWLTKKEISKIRGELNHGRSKLNLARWLMERCY